MANSTKYHFKAYFRNKLKNLAQKGNPSKVAHNSLLEFLFIVMPGFLKGPFLAKIGIKRGHRVSSLYTYSLDFTDVMVKIVCKKSLNQHFEKYDHSAVAA